MERFPKSLCAKLDRRTAEGTLRKLPEPNTLADFASNDYLGLARSEEVFNAAHRLLIAEEIKVNGATGSRLITGNHSLYTATEEFLAGFHNSESALIYNSGYDANTGFFSCVPQKEDIVLYDEYIHASIRDGLRLSYASCYKFPHNDTAALENKIRQYRQNGFTGEIYIVTESVFSMDGDSPDLQYMAAIAERESCRLIVDEAHAVGVLGDSGKGLVSILKLEGKIFARLVTFGKALGSHGAAVLCSKALQGYLVNFSRSFIYTTALPPHALATILCAYNAEERKSAQQRLKDNITLFSKKAVELGLTGFIPGNSAIHCVVIPGNDKVKSIAQQLQQQGYDVKPILSPTVPYGQERLRFCLHSYNTTDEICGVLESLAAILR